MNSAHEEPTPSGPESHGSQPSAAAESAEQSVATDITEEMTGRLPHATTVTTAFDEKDALDAYQHARQIVRLVQCSICNRPLKLPVTLPCGNSLCRACLPPAQSRGRITYPQRLSRSEGIACPFPGCDEVHPVEDCSPNVVLHDVVEHFREVVDTEVARSSEKRDEVLMREVPATSENLHFDPRGILDSSEKPSADLQIEPEIVDDEMTSTLGMTEETLESSYKSFLGGRLLATYAYADTGGLKYTSDVEYASSDSTEELTLESEATLLDEIKGFAYTELECHVCYSLVCEPVTTPCGHSFCRACLARVLDHSSLCAVCRRFIPMATSLQRQVVDRYLTKIVQSFWPRETQARWLALQEQQTMPGGLDTPLFVCTMAFPQMPMLLHIFEPRYRLMIRRALDKDRKFGMLMYNQSREPQGGLGRTEFMQLGVLLYIDHYEMFPDGRYFISCRGMSRFRVLAHDILDGYRVGKIEKLEDVSLAEEERIEAEELRRAAAAAAAADAVADTSTNTLAATTDHVANASLSPAPTSEIASVSTPSSTSYTTASSPSSLPPTSSQDAEAGTHVEVPGSPASDDSDDTASTMDTSTTSTTAAGEETETETEAGTETESGIGTDTASNTTNEGTDTTTATLPDLDTLSTQELLEIGLSFVQRAREQSARWLQGRIMEVYGGPPHDPAVFPYWFASVFPLRNEEKYRLLPTTSVRERLKITARWVRRIEAQRWFTGGACNVL